MTPRPSLGDMPKSSVEEMRGEVGVVGLETLFKDSRLPARSLGCVGGGTLAARFTLRLPPVTPSWPSLSSIKFSSKVSKSMVSQKLYIMFCVGYQTLLMYEN